MLQIAGIEDISSAETLSGLDLVVREEDRMPLDEGSAYVSDMVGCSLLDKLVPIGVVTDVQFPTAPDGTRLTEAAPLLVVDGAEQGEILVPFVKAFLQHVDIPGRKIVMNLPAGLVDVNRPV